MDDYVKGEEVKVPNGSIIKIAKYSPNGEYLALLTTSKDIYIMESSLYRELSVIDCNIYGDVWDIEFSKNNAIIGAAAGGRLELFNIPDGTPFKSIRPDHLLETQDFFTRLFFGRENVLIGSTKISPHLYIYSNYTSSDLDLLLSTYLPHTAIITSLYYISHECIISSYTDGICVKWDIDIARDSNPRKIFPTFHDDLPNPLPIPLPKITHMDISPDNKYVLLTHANSQLSLYEITRDGSIKFINYYDDEDYYKGVVEGEFEMKGKFMFHNENRFVISGSETCYIIIWDFETTDVIKRLHCRRELPVSILLNPLEELESFAALQRNGELFIWRKKINLN